VLPCVAVCCFVSQCVAGCRSVLQCVVVILRHSAPTNYRYHTAVDSLCVYIRLLCIHHELIDICHELKTMSRTHVRDKAME